MYENSPNNGMEIILSTAILHNLSIIWGDELPVDDHDDLEDHNIIVDFDGVNDQNRRNLGEQARNFMCEQMPPATAREQQRLRRVD